MFVSGYVSVFWGGDVKMTGRHKDGGMEEGGRGEVSLRYIYASCTQ
jgi:hypothetical protein